MLEEPILTAKNYFKYKYVLMNKGQLVKWEDGIDRIVDLDILPNTDFMKQETKSCVLKDEWEKFGLRLSVYLPFEEQQDQLFLQIQTSNNQNFGLDK